MAKDLFYLLYSRVGILDSIVEEAGSEISTITGEVERPLGEVESGEEKSERETLQDELQKAIEEENYESAALLRDKINELE